MTPRWPVRYVAPDRDACVRGAPAVGVRAFRAHRLLFDAATPAVGLLLLFGTLLALTLADATRNRKALQEVVQRQREESARVAGEMQAAQRIQLDTLPRARIAAAIRASSSPRRWSRRSKSAATSTISTCSTSAGCSSCWATCRARGCRRASSWRSARRCARARCCATATPTSARCSRRPTREVSRDNPAALFVTVFAGVLDLHSGELDYCNAGQENPWLVSPDGGGVTRLMRRRRPAALRRRRFRL